MDYETLERKWQKYWGKERIYSFDSSSKKPVYSIDTPPPTVSGKMHLGHAFSYSQQDFIARYKRMKGYNVFYPFGFDDNGLATERYVESVTKKRAVDMDRTEFNKLCLEKTKGFESDMKEAWSRIGISCDWNIIYQTISDHSIKTSQTSFVDIYEKERAYRKESPVMYCPECRTAIAQVELEDQELESFFSDLEFEAEGEKIHIATTRPELLPAIVAIFVNPEDKKNKRLVGKKAKVPLFDIIVPILEDHRVDPEKGTGIVMCCTFGDQTDIEWYKAHNLPLKNAIGPDGKMTEIAGKYKGMKIKEARKAITEDLEKEGYLKGKKAIKHFVNVHERCKTEIEFLSTRQWFIKYLDLKDEFIKRGAEINWFPEYMKTRYDNWIIGLQWDWCISRQRYFGVPFPVWYCKKCGKEKVAGKEELPVDPLERKPSTPCECGSKEFEAEKDVMDTWATSALTPQIALNWVKDKEFFKKMYPMDLRPQAHDIITFWAFNTIVKGLLHHNQVPWKNIMISGHAKDAKGRAMHKSLGNVVDPEEQIRKHSADIVRYWATSAKLGDDLPFQENDMVKGKKFVTKYYNAAKFVGKSLEGKKIGKYSYEELLPEDKWIISRLNEVKEKATESMDSYEFSKGFSPVREFFWNEFCDYYLEEVKHRTYKPEIHGKESKEKAQQTLYKVLYEVTRLFAPFLPFITEEVYQEIFKANEKKKSVHLTEWPEAREEEKSEYYSSLGREANKIIAGIRSYKTGNSLAMNAYLKEATVFIKGVGELRDKLEEASEIIRNTAKIGSFNVLEAEPPKKAEKIAEGVYLLIEL